MLTSFFLYPGNPAGIEVVVEIMLSMLAQNKHILRKVVNCIFKVISEQLTEPALQSILKVLLTEEDSQDDSDDDSDGEDEEDEKEEEDSDSEDEEQENEVWTKCIYLYLILSLLCTTRAICANYLRWKLQNQISIFTYMFYVQKISNIHAFFKLENYVDWQWTIYKTIFCTGLQWMCMWTLKQKC